MLKSINNEFKQWTQNINSESFIIKKENPFFQGMISNQKQKQKQKYLNSDDI